MPVQKCPLCLEVKDVVSSHLIPKRMYEYCRPEGANPIAITSELVIETSRQLKDYLLCRHCEDWLNKGGEMWILPLLAQYRGPFPFHAILTKLPPDVVDGDAAGYAAARNREIHADKLIHFAMGVFWKAAVHSWSGSKTEPLIQLGPYAESIRTFLRGESDFPTHMALTVGVLPPPVKEVSFHYPYRGSNTSWHNFLFYVSGIEFALAVGRAVNDQTRETCFACNPLHPILLIDFSRDITAMISRVWAKAHKAKNVQKYLKTRGGKDK